MTVVYDQKITSAFRNDAIKSVILIDDDYVPYEDIIKSSQEINKKIEDYLKDTAEEPISVQKHEEILNSLKLSIKQSSLATEVKEYFNSLSIICDVEKTTRDISAEKIRKSDLIVLDYQLDDKDPIQALNLIQELSRNSHMNIVVVYTNNDLNVTWMEIASCLRGSYNGDPEEYYSEGGWDDRWANFDEDYNPSSWDLSHQSLADYILTNELNPIKREIARLISGKSFPDAELIECYLEGQISKLNLLNNPRVDYIENTQGNYANKECQWLISGNVFVTLVAKNKEDDQIPKAEQIWKQVENALIDWAPSVYKVVASELQNKIENGRISFEAGQASDHKREAALLWYLLNNREEDIRVASGNMLENMLQDFSNDLLKDDSLIEFILDLSQNASNDVKQFVNYIDPKSDEEGFKKYKDFIEHLFKVVHENTNRSNEKLSDEYYSSVIHTLNEEISTTKILPRFVTTGLILVDRDEPTDWYLCVTPSCNSIPGQTTDSATKKIKPHRNHTFLKLERNNRYKDKLVSATQSKHLYITYESQKLALSVLDSVTGLPKIEKVVVLNHDDEPLSSDGKKVAFLSLEGNELRYVNKILKPVALLRPAYAARFQNTQSHYEGRIGVDFINLSI
ncbi:hypothetical protein KW478_21025 [Vibrio fluvialis]|nr:hypothetical protein [Vibrio fluvialis]